MNQLTDIEVTTPTTTEQWQQYYQLRWQVLRAPWQQPKGSEQDELEPQAVHRMIKNAQGEVIGVARLHFNQPEQAQVRYMAISEQYRGLQLGGHLLFALEQVAWQQNANEVTLFARETALAFYQRYGYSVVKKAHCAFGQIQHWQMRKTKPEKPLWFRHPAWLKALQHTWHTTIPISEKMAINVEGYTDSYFSVAADLQPNINLHHTMFAGSIYTLATLTGWGATYLALKERELMGDIVLAKADIKYLKPIEQQPSAKVTLAHCEGDLNQLTTANKARYRVPVTVFSGDTPAAQFIGYFAVIGKKVS